MPDEISARVNSIVAPSFDVMRTAVAIPLKFIHQSVAVISDESAPHFAPEREPLQDNAVYVSTANQNFYRPQFVLNTGATGKTDAHFLRDAGGKVRLEIVLIETAPFANAEPFNLIVTAAALRWNDQTGAQRFEFPLPTLLPIDDPADSTKPNYKIHLGAELTTAEIEKLNNALSNPAAAAILDVAFSYNYWIDIPAADGLAVDEQAGIFARKPKIGIFLEKFDPALISRVVSRPVLPHTLLMRQPLINAEANNDAALTPLNSPKLFRRGIPTRVKFDTETLIQIGAARRTQPNFRTAAFTRSISLTLNPNLAQNQHVYAAIRQTAGVGDKWENTAFGLIRKSNIANTIYRLPDEIRLAFSDELKAPHMIPVLFRDAATDQTRVRVVLQAASFHDPKKTTDLSDFLLTASGGAFAAPKIVSGGYKEAKLTLTGAFPEQIQALKGREFAIELEGTFELVLDLTLEFYRFLCELITRVGLTGEVVATLENPVPADAPPGTAPELLVRRVPMRLNFNDLAALPLEARISSDETSPETIEIFNRSGSELTCGGCLPRLLQIDDNSIVPLEVYKAETTVSFPAVIAPDGSLIVDVKPKVGGAVDASTLLWNAVQVGMFDLALTQNPDAILNRIHELAPAGSLALDITVESPIFALAELPPEFKDKLFRIVIEILRPGFAAQQITLSKNAASATLKMPQTLPDLIREDAQSIISFSYRVKNVYFTREGNWSEPKSAEGSSVFVFPNPSEV